MRRRTPFQLAAAALIALALVVAEAMSLVHSHDIDQHAAGEACKICICVAGLGAGAPSKVPPPDAPRVAVPGSLSSVLPVDLSPVDRPSARGPPSVS